MPVYNEENTVREIIRAVREVSIEKIDTKEIIIVNDGSTDRTREILESYGQKDIKIIHLEKNKGKGCAIREGLKYVTGDITIIQDGDLEYSPDDYDNLVRAIVVDGNEVVYGSRTINKENKHSYILYSLGGIFLSWLTNLLYGSHLTDEPTGYKVFRTGVLKNINLTSKRFEFCPEITAKVLKKNIEIKEIPIRYYPRKIIDGKKIRWYVGLKAIWTLIKYRFVD